MQIKTCEEYVLDRLHETEEKLDEADRNCENLMKKLESANEIIHMYENIFMEFGELVRFNSGDQVRVTVRDQSSYFNENEPQVFELITKKFPNLAVTDYRDSAKTEVRTAEGDIA